MLSLVRKTPILGALMAQVVAMPLVAAVTALLSGMVDQTPLIAFALFLQGAIAAVICRLFGLASWWLLIAFLFPLAMAGTMFVGNLPAWPFGIAFLVLAFVFSNTTRGRVPLYLTNAATEQTLADLVRERGARHFLDLGSGLGGVVRKVAERVEGVEALGVETAPGPFLVSWLKSRLSGHGEIRRQNLFLTDLSKADVVYAFLSPAPMPALYERARAMMKPGSLFVSNSFAVPDITPSEIWELDDRRKTRLYLYEMGEGSSPSSAKSEVSPSKS